MARPKKVIEENTVDVLDNDPRVVGAENPTLAKSKIRVGLRPDIDLEYPPKIRKFSGKHNFAGMDMSELFPEKVMKHADFTDANLEDTDFSGFNLQGSIFRRTNIKGANFYEADLRWTVFENCEGFNEADFTDCNHAEAQGL